MVESFFIKGIVIVIENEVIKNGYVGISEGKISIVLIEWFKEFYLKEI